jgi:hypothetical protein
MTDIVERLRNTVRTADLPFDQIDAERHEAADEIERLGALASIVREQGFEIERLRALVKDLADDLEAEVNGHYPPEVRAYPSEQRRYERDMANVYEARRALEPKP